MRQRFHVPPERGATAWLPLIGLLALAWFLIRVIPKPSRAAYPCQRAAFPLASVFVLWVAGAVAALLAGGRVRAWLRNARIGRVLPLLLVAACIWAATTVYTPATPVLADPAMPNDPIGVGRGIHPGRVVWVHDPNATDWVGTNLNGEDIGDGFWWEPQNTDQVVVDRMVSRAVRGLTHQPSDARAWEALFRQFNAQAGRGDRGYQPGEKVTIKINLVTSCRVHRNVDADGNQTTWLGWVNTSPQVVLALLRHLVHVVGVAENDIAVGDPSAYFPNHYWSHCHSEFPNVRYLAATSDWGRHGVQSSLGRPCEMRVYWSTPEASGARPDYLPVSYAEADYLINAACLKGHSAGISLCAKNHYGSLIRLPDEGDFYNLHRSLPNPTYTPGTGHYRAHVDITGHPDVGGKTLLYLIDGLYAGYYWNGRPYKWHLPPFGDGVTPDWPSSLFASMDPIAIDSVGHDFLLAEWPDVVTGGGAGPGRLEGGQEDYLHEGALAGTPPSGTVYDPDGDGTGLASLGVHEHWNNALEKQYSGNLGLAGGIELLAVSGAHGGDYDGDGQFTVADFVALEACLTGPAGPALPEPPEACRTSFDLDLDGDVDLGDWAGIQERQIVDSGFGLVHGESGS